MNPLIILPTTPGASSGDFLHNMWNRPVTINRNNFVYKSLSCFSFNHAVGCDHGCVVCFVPSTTANKQASRLEPYGVVDPDAEWGSYVMFRPWDEKDFLRSLNAAENTPISMLNHDGNRAVMYCTTTDPYQVVRHPDRNRRSELYNHSRFLIRRSLELIRDRSTINVRILTRSPLARLDFDLFRSFGNRLTFGMSLPTLRNDLLAVYEPNAPAPTQRLATLHAAKKAGLHVYVAIAPTYAECGASDIEATMRAVKDLDPLTVFHEPVNIRAKNVARIEASAAKLGVPLNTGVFANLTLWRDYARKSLSTAWEIGHDLGIQDRLHLWPDASLGTKTALQEVDNPVGYHAWLTARWHRVSEWPR